MDYLVEAYFMSVLENIKEFEVNKNKSQRRNYSSNHVVRGVVYTIFIILINYGA